MFLAIFAAIFFVSLFASSASAATVTKTFTFNLIGSLDNTTNLKTYTFNVTDVGKITANVTWVGNATNLTLSLTKSGIANVINQTDSNATSFDTSYTVSSENITSGLTWTVAAVDYFGNTSANGTVVVSWNALPPSVTTLDATSITPRSAMLRASINSNSLNTTYDFVNETTLVDFMTGDGSYLFVSGPYNGSVNVSANMTKMVAIASLLPSTNYTFRVRAQNDAGATLGNPVSFVTLAETATTTTTTSSSTSMTTSSTSSTTTQPPTTTTTSATNATTTTTTTTQGGGFFGNVWNIIFAIVLGIAIFAAVFFMYRRGWHL